MPAGLINGNRDKKTRQLEQPLLWQSLALDPTDRLKTAMRQALTTADMSREQIVDEMNRLAELEGIRTGRSERTSVDILNKWVAPGDERYIIPTKLLPIFCLAVDSLLPLAALAAPAGGSVISMAELKRLEWANVELERRRLRRRARRLAEEVGA